MAGSVYGLVELQAVGTVLAMAIRVIRMISSLRAIAIINIMRLV